jgi:hypothetical protein
MPVLQSLSAHIRRQRVNFYAFEAFQATALARRSFHCCVEQVAVAGHRVDDRVRFDFERNSSKQAAQRQAGKKLSQSLSLGRLKSRFVSECT